jgi:hypothetical protein
VALTVQRKAQGPAHQPLRRAQQRAARLQLPGCLRIQHFSGSQRQLWVARTTLAHHGRQAAQAAVQVRRGADMAHAGCGQGIGNAEMARDLQAGGAQVWGCRGSPQRALLRGRLDQGIQDEHLADDHVRAGGAGC